MTSIELRDRRVVHVEEHEYEIYENDSANDLDIPDGGLKSYLVVVGLFFGFIVNAGLINSIGTIQTYVSNHQLSDVKGTTVSWIFSVYLCLTYAIGVFIGPIFDRHGALFLEVCSTTLIFLSLFGVASCREVWQFLCFIFLGIGSRLGMTPLYGVINHWFLRKRGTVTGIATVGGSLGGLIIPLMLRKLYSEYGFIWGIRVLSFFFLGCNLIAIFLGRERIKRDKEVDNSAMNSKWEKLTKGMSLLDLGSVKDASFATLIVGAFFGELSLILINTYFASYAIAQGVSESTSYLLLTVWNAAGIFGRCSPAFVSDFWGKFNINILMLIGLDFVVFALWFPFGHYLKILFAFSALGGFFLASILTMFPSCLAQISAVEKYGERLGLTFFFLSIGNLVGVAIGASIIGQKSIRDYDHFVIFLGTMTIISTTFWILSRYTLVRLRFSKV